MVLTCRNARRRRSRSRGERAIAGCGRATRDGDVPAPRWRRAAGRWRRAPRPASPARAGRGRRWVVERRGDRQRRRRIAHDGGSAVSSSRARLPRQRGVVRTRVAGRAAAAQSASAPRPLDAQAKASALTTGGVGQARASAASRSRGAAIEPAELHQRHAAVQRARRVRAGSASSARS